MDEAEINPKIGSVLSNAVEVGEHLNEARQRIARIQGLTSPEESRRRIARAKSELRKAIKKLDHLDYILSCPR